MLSVVAIGGVVGAITGFYYLSRPVPGTPEFYLARADEMAFNNNWIGAAPVYKTAQSGFAARGDVRGALYAEVEPDSGRHAVGTARNFD